MDAVRSGISGAKPGNRRCFRILALGVAIRQDGEVEMRPAPSRLQAVEQCPERGQHERHALIPYRDSDHGTEARRGAARQDPDGPGEQAENRMRGRNARPGRRPRKPDPQHKLPKDEPLRCNGVDAQSERQRCKAQREGEKGQDPAGRDERNVSVPLARIDLQAHPGQHGAV